MAILSMSEEGANSLPNDQLAARAQAGCQVSFEKLVYQYHQPIYNFLFHMIRNAHDAEDLTQETFIRASQHLGKYKSEYKFSTWLFTIARNCAVTHFRKERRIEKVSLEDWQHTAEAPAGDQPECGDQNIWHKARQLKPKQYEVLWLHYHEGFSVKEAAEIMRTNTIHIKVLLYRARQALARKLKTTGENE